MQCLLHHFLPSWATISKFPFFDGKPLQTNSKSPTPISRPSDIYKSPPPLDNSPVLRRSIAIADTMDKYMSKPKPMILKDPAAVSVGFVFAVWVVGLNLMFM